MVITSDSFAYVNSRFGLGEVSVGAIYGHIDRGIISLSFWWRM